jgi:hypothetical protein
MKRLAAVLLLVIALVVGPAGLSLAWTGGGGWHGGAWHGGAWHGGSWHGGGWGWHGGWHGTVVVGGPWWWGGYPYPYAYAYPYPYWYYPPPYSYPYPSGALQGPSVYVQQSPAASAADAQTYWYYCASARAYYPKVEKCPEAWIKVPPKPQ